MFWKKNSWNYEKIIIFAKVNVLYKLFLTNLQLKTIVLMDLLHIIAVIVIVIAGVFIYKNKRK